MFDFRAVDLLDRMDWNSPEVPVILAFLNKISHVCTVSNGVENMRMHVITVAGELTPVQRVKQNEFVSTI